MSDPFRIDPYRDCVFCGVDCSDDEPEHADTCPAVTGLWPVRPEDLGPVCTHCGKRAVGMKCMDCGSKFSVGDFYVLRDSDTGQMATRPHIGDVVCIGCGANTESDSG